MFYQFWCMRFSPSYHIFHAKKKEKKIIQDEQTIIRLWLLNGTTERKWALIKRKIYFKKKYIERMVSSLPLVICFGWLKKDYFFIFVFFSLIEPLVIRVITLQHWLFLSFVFFLCNENIFSALQLLIVHWKQFKQRIMLDLTSFSSCDIHRSSQQRKICLKKLFFFHQYIRTPDWKMLTAFFKIYFWYGLGGLWCWMVCFSVYLPAIITVIYLSTNKQKEG